MNHIEPCQLTHTPSLLQSDSSLGVQKSSLLKKKQPPKKPVYVAELQESLQAMNNSLMGFVEETRQRRELKKQVKFVEPTAHAPQTEIVGSLIQDEAEEVDEGEETAEDEMEEEEEEEQSYINPFARRLSRRL